MKNSELCFLSIGELSRLIAKKQISPVDVVKSLLERIDRLDKRLNAYITVLREESLEAARKAEQAIAAGNRIGPLHGIPIALKDLCYTKGVRTTAGSKVLADFVPGYDCTLVERFHEAGAIILGKANLHEFALGATNENPHYGNALNPWDTGRITGGSSGGSAAAVAASLASGAIGSDTGGSIRIPSSLCGIVGLKPTFGRVSKYGVLDLCWSLDHVGPMTRTVEDAAMILQATAGYDPNDPSTSRLPVPNYTRSLRKGVQGLRVGLPSQYFFEELNPDVSAAVNEALNVLRGLGAADSQVSLPHASLGPRVTWTIISGEAASVHRKWLNERAADYGSDVRARLELAQFTLATQYIQAQRVRRLIRDDFQKAFRQVDVIVTPSTPITAPKVGERQVLLAGRLVTELTGLGRFASPINGAGLPALTLPCGFTSAGLPIGLQIIGRPFDEATVLRAAYAYEAATDWHKRRPQL